MLRNVSHGDTSCWTSRDHDISNSMMGHSGSGGGPYHGGIDTNKI